MSLEWFGLSMGQNEHGPAAINRVLCQHGPFRQIVEIGTGSGGLSALLAIYATQNGARFVTYDVSPCRNRVLQLLGADVRQANCWDQEDEIGAVIRSAGNSLVLCDGGNKIREFRTFAKYLQPSDVIMAHDYAVSRDRRPSDWAHCEITYDDIRDVCEEHNLMTVAVDTVALGAWTAWVKNGEN